MRFIDREEVARRLTYEICIPIVRQAMIAFSRGETKQLLRSIIPLSEGRLFGIMPGAMGAHARVWGKVDQRISRQLRSRNSIASGSRDSSSTPKPAQPFA